jgi:hypothetical protein
MEHQSFIQTRREGNWQKCACLFTPQNVNVYDLLILQFRQSAALNIVVISNRTIGRKMRMKVIVLYSVHHFVVTNGFNIVAFKYSSREQAHLFIFFRIRFFFREFSPRYTHVVFVVLVIQWLLGFPRKRWSGLNNYNMCLYRQSRVNCCLLHYTVIPRLTSDPAKEFFG